MQFGRFQKEKGVPLSHLPTLSLVVCKLAHSCCVTGKGCPGTQPLTKLFAAKQWQLFTSKHVKHCQYQGTAIQGVNTPLGSKHFKTTSLPCSPFPFLLPDGPLFAGSSQQDLPATGPPPRRSGLPLTSPSPLPLPQLSSHPKGEPPSNFAVGFKIALQIKNKQVL